MNQKQKCWIRWGLFYASRLGNRVHHTFIFTLFGNFFFLHIILSNTNHLWIDIFEQSMGLEPIWPFHIWMDFGVMTINGYFTLPRFLNLEPPNQTQCTVILRIPSFRWDVLLPYRVGYRQGILSREVIKFMQYRKGNTLPLNSLSS